MSSIFYPRATENGLELRVNFFREAIEVYADRDKIIEVFTNLASAEIEAFTLWPIEISVVDKENWVECSVFDTGRGIAEGNLSKIFDRFQQFGMVDSPGERGTGLGLSIAKGVVELHRGEIWVESVLDKGSKFNFTLPKYSKDEILEESIEKGIMEARKVDKGLSVFVIKLDNSSDLEKEFGEEKVQEILLKILETFNNVIRSRELVTTKGKNEIILLAEVNKQDVPTMNARLRRVLKDAILGVDEELEMNFSYGYSTYPDDATNASVMSQ